MSAGDIVEIVKIGLGIDVTASDYRKTTHNVDAQAIAVLLMDEYGIDKPTIAGTLKVHRTDVYYKLKAANDLLEFDKVFKLKYWTCNAVRLRFEGEAA